MHGIGTFSITGPVDKEAKYETFGSTDTCTVVIRTDNGWRTKEGHWVERLQQVGIKFFGARLENVKRLKIGVGDVVIITGRIGGREYNGKFYPDLSGDEIRLVQRHSTGRLPMNDKAFVPDPANDDDLPF